MNESNLSVLITEGEIKSRILELGGELTKRFKNEKDVIAVCVLKGSMMFYSDMIRTMNVDLQCEFLGVSSYNGTTQSSGEVKLTLDLSTPVEGKHVILFEDIVDTGLTMNYMKKNLSSRNPKSLTTVTLLFKPDALKTECQLDYVGFKIPNDFVVGYGLDYQGFYRNLPYIAQVFNLN